MNAFRALWRKLAKSKTYREEFVAAQLKRGIPFQIRTLMKQQNLSQEELATRSNLTQGVVSRAANPNYGNLTINTIIRVAAGLDVAFIGRFVPFSELGKWFINLSEESVRISSFNEENEVLGMEGRPPEREESLSGALLEKASESGQAKTEEQGILQLLSGKTEQRKTLNVLPFSVATKQRTDKRMEEYAIAGS